MTGVLISREDAQRDTETHRQKKAVGRQRQRLEGGDHKPGTPGASRGWKRQEGPSPGAPEGTQPCRNLDLGVPASRM